MQKIFNLEHATLVAASGLFDADYYRAHNPDVTKAGLDPIEHFLQLGGFQGRDPNAYFSMSSYLEDHPEIRSITLNPLVHFLLYESSDTRAIRDFDSVWYRNTYPESCRNGLHPLGHYLLEGSEKGYLRHACEIAGLVQAREIRVLFSAPASLETVLFVTHAPTGRIKPHVLRYLDSFRVAGLSVTAIVVSDDIRSVDHNAIAPHCNGLILRQNGGYDFAAWAHALDYVDLSKTRILFFANDSVVGPLDDALFLSLIGRVRDSEAELIGTTDNMEINYHFQSFLFAVKDFGISQVIDFLSNVRILEEKQQVIIMYELRFFDKLKGNGVKTEVLFPCGSVAVTRSTIYWRELVSEGFPFIKVEVLRTVSRMIWKKTLRNYRYPVEYADLTLQITRDTNSTKTLNGTHFKKSSRKPSASKYRFYRVMEIITRPFSARKSMEYAIRALRRKRD